MKNNKGSYPGFWGNPLPDRKVSEEAVLNQREEDKKKLVELMRVMNKEDLASIINTTYLPWEYCSGAWSRMSLGRRVDVEDPNINDRADIDERMKARGYILL